MKGGVLLALYLVRDTLARWVEQPAGVIAKGAVVGFMVGTATAILASFALAADELERRLGLIGLDRFYVRETVIPAVRRPGSATVAELLRESGVLGPGGRVVSFLATGTRAQTELSRTLPVFVYDTEFPPAEAFAAFAPGGGPGGDAVEGSPNGVAVFLPEVAPGVSVELSTSDILSGRSTTTGISAVLPEWAIGVDPDGLVLVPEGHGFVDARNAPVRVSVVEMGPQSPPLDDVVLAITRLARAERIDATVRSPGPILASLEDLRSRRDVVRAAIAVVFGAGAAFVFAAMGVLEYRDVRFVGALLRSFGAGAWALFLRHAIEQLLIANAGLATALGLMWAVRGPLVEALGYPLSGEQLSDLASIVAPEVVVIALIMNGGVMVGMVPVAWLVGKPVGRVLS